MSAVQKAVEERLRYLHRELEIASREAARELFDTSALPAGDRALFQEVNQGIVAARAAIPLLQAEIAELQTYRPGVPRCGCGKVAPAFSPADYLCDHGRG